MASAKKAPQSKTIARARVPMDDSKFSRPQPTKPKTKVVTNPKGIKK